MNTPVTGFRLSTAELGALDSVCSDWGGLTRTAALRKLIHDQVERAQLGNAAAEAFITRLHTSHGAGAELAIELRGAVVESATIDGRELADEKVELVFGAGGRAELALDEVEGPASLILAEMYPPPEGHDWSYRFHLAALTPKMGVS
jgi:hypothetical protein